MRINIQNVDSKMYVFTLHQTCLLTNVDSVYSLQGFQVPMHCLDVYEYICLHF